MPSGRRLFLFAIAAVLPLTPSAIVRAADAPIVIKFSHVVAADTPKGKAAETFKRLAEPRRRTEVRLRRVGALTGAGRTRC